MYVTAVACHFIISFPTGCEEKWKLMMANALYNIRKPSVFLQNLRSPTSTHSGWMGAVGGLHVGLFLVARSYINKEQWLILSF